MAKKNVNGKRSLDDEATINLKSLVENLKIFEQLKKPDEEIELDLEKLAGNEKNQDENLDFNLENIQFHQFMNADSTETGAPVLERIAERQTGPVFVPIGQRRQETFDTSAKDEGFNYIPSGGGTGETKYFAEPGIEAGPRNIDFNQVGRQRSFEPENQQAFFSQASESKQWGFENQSQERMWQAERTDLERAGKHDPHERHDTKYEKYKPKLPKN